MHELEQLLAASRAADAFKNDVRSFYSNGDAGRIAAKGGIPHVKIGRLLKHVLASAPELPIEQLSLRGYSGCSDFGGIVEIQTASGAHTYEFHWDCRWRAQEEGWVDYFGFPDQIRAAREFDWRCFRVWRSKE